MKNKSEPYKKWGRIVFSLIFALSFHLNILGQNEKITISETSIPLLNLFKNIESQSDYMFNYADVDVENINVSVDVKDATIRTVLAQVLDRTPLTWTINNRNISISVKKATKSETSVKIVVSGVVKDSNGEPLPGVSVYIKDLKTGVITDIDGKYSIEIKSRASKITFSHVGFKTQEIAPGLRNIINIVLIEDDNIMEEIVVLGYGSLRRKEITGSVASVRMKELPEAGGATVAQFLSGRVAGLTTTLASAQPNGAVNMQIRGAATGRSPLIIIDGFPVSDDFVNPTVGIYKGGQTDAVLSALNPNDIESIDILKDASATSIYGSKAAGGVILVTTKRGRTEKITVNYTASVGWSKAVNMPKLLNATEFMVEKNREAKEKFMYNNQIYPYGANDWNNYPNYNPVYGNADFDKWKGNPGTVWEDEILRTAAVSNMSLNVQGGGTATKYFLSLGYFDQQGLLRNNNVRKYTGLVNIDQKLSKNINLGLTMNLSRLYMDNIPLQSGYAEESDILRSAFMSPPNMPVRDENGKYSINPYAPYLPNVASLLDIKNKTRNDRLIANVSLTYNILQGLNIKGTLGTDILISQGMGYLPSTTMMGSRVNGRADRRLDEKNDYQAQLFANYYNVFGEKHIVSATAGTEFLDSSLSGFNSTSTNFISDGFLWYNLAMGTGLPSVGSYGSKSQSLAYVGRMTYNYDERYFVTANARIDGSSNFTDNHQWGFFPGISIGWDMAKEPFMKDFNNIIYQLKFRAGYGQTGNDKIGTAFANYYVPGDKTMFGNSINSSMYLGSLKNPDLKWETQTDFNIGMDFTLFKGKITGSFEYYNRVISDILGWRSLSSNSEVTGVAANLDSKKQTYGYEVAVSSENINTPDLKWDSNITFTYYRDRWLKRDKNWKPDINSSKKQYFEELWFHVADGLIQPGEILSYTDKPIPGTIKLKDIDGYLKDEKGAIVLGEDGIPKRTGKPDGKIDNADLVKVGVNAPFTIGFNNSFSYKRFDANISLYGMFNRWKVNATRQLLTDSYWMKDGLNQSVEVKNRWNSDNMNGGLPSSLQGQGGFGNGDFYLENASFIRLSNLSIGYTFPINKMAEDLRVFVVAQNLFTITPYSGMDPETDVKEASYPNQRTFQLGINIKF